MAESLFVVSRIPAGVPAAPCGGDCACGEKLATPDVPGLDAETCSAFEEDLIGRLRQAGRRVVAVPYLYYLGADDPAVQRLAAFSGDVVVAAWMYPRPAFWTLHALGIEGTDPDGADPVASAAEARTIRCVDMRASASPADCAGAMLGGVDAGRAEGVREDLVGEVISRWHPVLDYSDCVSCGKCLDFCLFGAFERRDGRVLVVAPEQCKPGCPACARVCPAGAIMFPHYSDDPAIAGAPGMRVEPGNADIASLLRSFACPTAAGSPCPVCGCGCDCERSPDGTAPPGKTVCPACGCICESPGVCACSSRHDDLRALADALEEFDD